MFTQELFVLFKFTIQRTLLRLGVTPCQHLQQPLHCTRIQKEGLLLGRITAASDNGRREFGQLDHLMRPGIRQEPDQGFRVGSLCHDEECSGLFSILIILKYAV